VLLYNRTASEHLATPADDDSWAALRGVAANRAVLAPSGPQEVCGDSAGGNISAVMALRAKAAGGPAIDLQVLVYPVTDADFDNETYVDPENQLMLSRDSMIWFWDHYAPDPAVRAEPEASPIKAEDLAGLPPAVV